MMELSGTLTMNDGITPMAARNADTVARVDNSDLLQLGHYVEESLLGELSRVHHKAQACLDRYHDWQADQTDLQRRTGFVLAFYELLDLYPQLHKMGTDLADLREDLGG